MRQSCELLTLVWLSVTVKLPGDLTQVVRLIENIVIVRSSYCLKWYMRSEVVGCKVVRVDFITTYR